MLKTGKRIWALLLAIGMLAGQLASVAMAEDSPAVAQDSGQVDSGRAASSGPVQVDGFTLAFADGTTPQEGGDKDYESIPGCLYLHPQNGKELLLSGSNEGVMIIVISNRSGIYEGRIRLTNDIKTAGFFVGGVIPGGSAVTTHLALNGGEHSVTNLDVQDLSRVAITGGLRVNKDITVGENGTLTASGPFSQADGETLYMMDGSRLELKDQPSADWKKRLMYDDSVYSNPPPDGKGRAVFADGEFIVNKAGLTQVSFPPVVTGVSPKGSGAPVSGAIVIDFNEAMDTGAGTVTLTQRGGSSRTLTGGRWNSPDNTQFTIGYSGLADSTAYQVGIAGFQSAAGFKLAADHSHGFTTGAASPTPAPAPVVNSSSGGGSSGPEAPLLRKASKTAYTIGAVEMRRLITQADKNGWDIVRASGSQPITVKAEAWKLLEDRRFVARSVAGNAVRVQLTFPEPWKLTEDMAVSGYVDGVQAERVRALFEKWFANPLRVIHLEHAGEFGGPVEIAAKVDLTGLDPSQLYFYSYDAKTNSYKPIENPNFRIDQNGYLHFVTTLAGDIIISEGQLEKK